MAIRRLGAQRLKADPWCSLRQIKERERSCHHFMHEAERDFADGLPFSFFPVLGADVVAQDDSTDGMSGGDFKFEGVAYGFAGDGAENSEAGFGIITGVAEDNGGTAACLLTACLRIED